MEISVENCEYAQAALIGFKKTVEETISAVRLLSVELDALDSKLHKLSQRRTECVIHFKTPKGKTP